MSTLNAEKKECLPKHILISYKNVNYSEECVFNLFLFLMCLITLSHTTYVLCLITSYVEIQYLGRRVGQPDPSKGI